MLIMLSCPVGYIFFKAIPWANPYTGSSQLSFGTLSLSRPEECGSCVQSPPIADSGWLAVWGRRFHLHQPKNHTTKAYIDPHLVDLKYPQLQSGTFARSP